MPVFARAARDKSLAAGIKPGQINSLWGAVASRKALNESARKDAGLNPEKQGGPEPAGRR